MRVFKLVFKSVLVLVLAMTPVVAVQPSSNAATDYRSTVRCYVGGSSLASWMQFSSWLQNDGTRMYHIAYREDLSTNGTSFRYIKANGVVIRRNSPSDNNPQEFYKSLAPSRNTLEGNWWDIVGNVPVFPLTCAKTN